MANNKLGLSGPIAALRAQLRALPKELHADGGAIVHTHAEEAAREIRDEYPEREGRLKRGVRVEHNTSSFATQARVVSKQQTAHLYEFGTQVRTTEKGANRGAMPPAPTFIPIVIRRRRRMFDALKTLLQRKGLKVSGG